MLRAAVVVALIGLGDSLNPSTVAPSMLLAMGPSPVRRVLEFAAGAFATSLTGGVLLLLGPGHWLLGLLPHPGPHKRHLLELAGGAVLLGVAALVWGFRRRLAGGVPGSRGRAGSAFAAGATVMVAELPTAFPYFGAIAVIVGSGQALSVQLGLVVLFNVLFIAPLLGIAVVLVAAPTVRRAVLEPAAEWLGRNWPGAFAALALVLGIVLAGAGAVGLAGEG